MHYQKCKPSAAAIKPLRSFKPQSQWLEYDLVLIVEGGKEAATAVLLKTGSLGNVRTQTLRGFSVEEMRKIIDMMP
jgi:uncharacterized protein with GYD domain